jgi:hypothetical protein
MVSIGKLGISIERNQSIPWSVIDNEGIVQTDKNVVLGKWKSDFEQLFSIDQITRPPVNDNDTYVFLTATFFSETMLFIT